MEVRARARVVAERAMARARRVYGVNLKFLVERAPVEFLVY
jgi:hypothetical protein